MYSRICKLGIQNSIDANKKLVSADDELREELVRQTVKVVAVEFSIWACLEVGLMLCHMIPHFSHGITNSDVVVEELTMSSCLPLSECWKLLGDGVEKTNNHTDRSGLHIVTELVDDSRIGNTVVAVELHLLPDGKKNRSEHEDRRPVLEPVTAVYTGV